MKTWCRPFTIQPLGIGNDFRRFIGIRNSPAIASSTSSGVTSPCTTPNSLVTITKLPRARRKTPNRLIDQAFPAPLSPGRRGDSRNVRRSSSSATSKLFARTIPIISSSRPDIPGTGYAEKRVTDFSYAEIRIHQLISPAAVIMPRRERDARVSTPLIM